MRYQGISLALVLAAAALLQACATPIADEKLDARALAKSSPSSYNKFVENVDPKAKEAELSAADAQLKAE